MLKSVRSSLRWLLIVLLSTSIAHADLVVHLPLDGDFADATANGNDGTFIGEEFPQFVDGYDDSEEGAAHFDGIDDYVEILHSAGLPLYTQPGYSVAMWVRGFPQPDRRVFSESSATEASTLVNIGTERTGATGAVDIYIRTGTGAALRNHVLSTGSAFDGAWHHIAWVDEGGQIALYIDGVLDATVFDFNKPDLTIDITTIGGILRPSAGAPVCCNFEGDIDDVRLYDHALTEEEVLELLPLDDCPADGDTHCSGIEVTPPVGGNVPGLYTVTADADDESGDTVLYLFRAEGADGTMMTAGPQEEEFAEFQLDQDTWTITVTVDDDALCRDEAADFSCSTEVVIDCPAVGDTHCDDFQVLGPIGGGPGLYSATVFGALDESGDIILYNFLAEDETGTVLRSGPRVDSFFDFNITSPGLWTFRSIVDDDPSCDDVADDNTCEETIDIGCPADGDTHCDDMLIEGPDGGNTPGSYLVTVQDSFDDSGDLITFLFRAERGDGRTIEIGPLDVPSTLMTLGAGEWTIQVIVDDDPLCDDQAPDGICEQNLTIEGGAPRMISHWTFDETLEDSEPAGNDGFYLGGAKLDPTFTEGFDGTASGAILLNGVDELIQIDQVSNLPLNAHDSFSIAMWVKGGPQSDFRVFSEASTLNNNPLFNIGTQNLGQTSQVDLFVRAPGAGAVLSHRWSDQDAFDDSWHHIAWVDEDGDAILYIDGIRDATDYTYNRAHIGVDTTTIGGILRAAPSHWFTGSIDDVRVYNYAISEAEVIDLVPEPADCSSSGDTHCGSIEIVRPESGFEGVHAITALGASDDSGDAPIYTFVAERGDGLRIQSGPQVDAVAFLDLQQGDWTITVTVDDDLLCRASAADSACTTDLTVDREPEILLTHLNFDGDTLDAQPAENDGEFLGGDATFAPDRDGVPGAAASFDGVDDYVNVLHNEGLPMYSRTRWSVAMWVRGNPPTPDVRDRRVWSEGSDANNSALFNIGTHWQGTGGQVDLFVRGEGGGQALPHRLSTGIAFDGTWHHLAWIDDDGDAVLYIDGVPDATDYSYNKPVMDLNTTTVGGILRATTCCHFEGEIDDVRLYNYALSDKDVAEIIDPGGEKIVFHRSDATNDGNTNITDGVFVLNFLFLGGPAPECLEAADADDSGILNITDGVYILNFLFLGGPDPASPGASPNVCGSDPEGSPDLGCESYTGCN